MISGHGTIEAAVRATKLGAYDFLEKPLSLDRTLLVLRNAIKAHQLREDNQEFARQLAAKGPVTGKSVPMKALRQQIKLMAPTNGRVLIYGESGTGKELIARAMHAESLRRDRVFVELNCAAIPEDFIETELFGYRHGASPGGPNQPAEKRGTFERADGGTLFLDEVGDMSLKTQAKVLRALDEQRFYPVGASTPVHIDARVIAATNKDLEEEIARGNFREDLFYRLNVIPFFVPPLRDRKEDIPLLVKEFLHRVRPAIRPPPRRNLRRRHSPQLKTYHWPGNVRELRNVIERVLILNPKATAPRSPSISPCSSSAPTAARDRRTTPRARPAKSSPPSSRPAKPTSATTSSKNSTAPTATSPAPPKPSASNAPTSTAK